MKRLDAVTVAALALAGVLCGTGCVTREVRTDTFVTYEVIRAPEAPPPRPVGAVLTAPSPAPAGATWMEPYWMWSGSAYTWMVGRWIPTLAGYAFLQPQWVLGPHGWTLVGGGWAGADGRVVATPPPVAPPSAGGACVEAPSTSVAVGTPRAPHGDAIAPEHDYARRTVTLSHHSYAPLRTHDDDDDDAPRTAPPSRGYAPAPEPTYRSSAPPTSAPSSSASGSSSSESSASRTGYTTSSTASSPSSTSSGVSVGIGSRSDYVPAGSSASTSGTRAPD